MAFFRRCGACVVAGWLVGWVVVSSSHPAEDDDRVVLLATFPLSPSAVLAATANNIVSGSKVEACTAGVRAAATQEPEIIVELLTVPLFHCLSTCWALAHLLKMR